MVTSYTPKIRVLIPLHHGVDTLDFAGAFELLSMARSVGVANRSDTAAELLERADEESKRYSDESPALLSFEVVTTSLTSKTETEQGASIGRSISMREAYEQLPTFDIMVIPGGNSQNILDAMTEPLNLITAFASLESQPSRLALGSRRILMSICTGALFLAKQGQLDHRLCTTNSGDISRLREIMHSRGLQDDKVIGNDRADVRFVVNLPADEMPIGSPIIMTSRGPIAGMDMTLWLIEQLIGAEARKHIEGLIEYDSKSDCGLLNRMC